MPFLTELDERAEVKGSSDPLGLMALWSRFGREVVGNLTTVSNSVRGFTTLLIGHHLADLLREQLRGEAPTPLDTFIKFEQLCGYARVRKYADTSVRGYRRASRRLNELRRIPISTDFADQILSSQKIGGLWGLFTVPARSSGLVEPGDVRLTDVAHDFVQRHYFPMLGGNAGVNALLGLLQRESFLLEPTRRHEALLDSLARVHARRLRADERAFYREHLVWGGTSDPTNGRQRQMADILLSIDTDEFGFPEFRQVQKRARVHEGLAASLERIAHVERLIAPAALLFSFLQERHNQAVGAVARQIEETWQRPLRLDLDVYPGLQPEFASTSSVAEAGQWLNLARAFAAADYAQVIELLVDLNTRVMLRRNGGDAWIAIENGCIRVRRLDERGELLPVAEAEDLWRSTYFINSLWNVAHEVEA